MTIFTDEQMDEYTDKLVWYNHPDNISGSEEADVTQLKTSGHVSKTISSDATYISFGFWFGSDAEEAGTRSASLIISDLTIDGMKVF